MNRIMAPRRLSTSLLVVTLGLGAVACQEDAGAPSADPSAKTPTTATATAATTATTDASAAVAAPVAGDAVDPAFDRDGYAALLERLSEPDGEFFSDNFISNETSYLQPAKLLTSRPKGGVYIGVGPEQNFTYLAMTEPSLAFILDIRRDNLVLHLLYKAAFDLASSRSHFMALLVGAEHAADSDPGPDASLEEVLEHAQSKARSDETFEAIHKLLANTIADKYGIELGGKDRKSLRRAHHAFFEAGVDIRFELKENSTRKYPSLRELLSAKAPDGQARGFLVEEASFRTVQRMQRENRVIPMVGDFGGDRAIAELGKLLEERKETVRHFYTSNVEQYLMVDGKWWKWQRNVAALPIDDDSAFIRGYLDQGKRHPNQMKGHRTASVLQPMTTFVARKKPYRSMWALCSDGVLPDSD
jgi:hypothetical protein